MKSVWEGLGEVGTDRSLLADCLNEDQPIPVKAPVFDATLPPDGS
jgi:hypothetical protein